MPIHPTTVVVIFGVLVWIQSLLHQHRDYIIEGVRDLEHATLKERHTCSVFEPRVAGQTVVKPFCELFSTELG